MIGVTAPVTLPFVRVLWEGGGVCCCLFADRVERKRGEREREGGERFVCLFVRGLKSLLIHNSVFSETNLLYCLFQLKQ